jgi:hypothetical protein
MDAIKDCIGRYNNSRPAGSPRPSQARFQTPSSAFGAEYMLGIAGVRRTDLDIAASNLPPAPAAASAATARAATGGEARRAR